MTPRQIELVRESWNHASPIAETIVRLFYRRLFELSPKLRDRIQTSMCEQSDHLLEAVDDLVERIDTERAGLERADAAIVEAWTWSFEQELGRHADQATCDAWQSAFSTRAGLFLQEVALGKVVLANA
ncbi:MAG: hypothetical protein AAF266_02920 [Planctomycetota bacterium]